MLIWKPRCKIWKKKRQEWWHENESRKFWITTRMISEFQNLQEKLLTLSNSLLSKFQEPNSKWISSLIYSWDLKALWIFQESRWIQNVRSLRSKVANFLKRPWIIALTEFWTVLMLKMLTEFLPLIQWLAKRWTLLSQYRLKCSLPTKRFNFWQMWCKRWLGWTKHRTLSNQ